MIRYVPHARDRLRERGITEAEVEVAVTNPDVTRPGSKPGREQRQAEVNGRRIAVIVAHADGGDDWVISAWIRSPG
jgi:hypothetical protein